MAIFMLSTTAYGDN